MSRFNLEGASIIKQCTVCHEQHDCGGQSCTVRQPKTEGTCTVTNTENAIECAGGLPAQKLQVNYVLQVHTTTTLCVIVNSLSCVMRWHKGLQVDSASHCSCLSYKFSRYDYDTVDDPIDEPCLSMGHGT